MNTIEINQREINIPETWNDLPTLRQVVHLFNIVTVDTPKFLDRVVIQKARCLEATKVILGITDQFMQDLKAQRIEEHGEEAGEDIFYAELDQLVKVSTYWLYEPVDDDSEDAAKLRLTLTKNPYPVLEHKKKHKKSRRPRKEYYHGPADGLDNLTLYELSAAFTAFESFLSTNDPAKADELLAILWRPPKPATKHNKRSNYEGDIRLPYANHESTVPQRAKTMAKLPKSLKSLLLFWFASCRTSIINQYQNIFKNKDENRQGNDYGWAGVLLTLTNDTIAHLDDVGDQNFHNAFTYLSMLEDQRLAAEMWSRKKR